MAHEQVVGPRPYNGEGESLPGYLRRGKQGSLWFINPEAKGKEGSWNMVVDFGKAGEELREPLDLEAMRDAGNGNVFWGEDLDQGRISEPFLHITHLANRFELSHPNVQLLYTANFMAGTRSQLDDVINYAGQEATVLAPERGGGIVKLLFAAKGFKPEQMPDYQASRIPGPDGAYTVALRFDQPWLETGNLIFADDCWARRGTELASFMAWENLHGRPKKYGVLAGVGVRRSVYARAAELDAVGSDHLMVFGAESNAMDGHDYLLLTDQEKARMRLPENFGARVSDMGVAMELDSPARQSDMPILRLIAASGKYDQLISGISRTVIEAPQLLLTGAESLRKRISEDLP